jgi:two-component system, OmpR family, response regulator
MSAGDLICNGVLQRRRQQACVTFFRLTFSIASADYDLMEQRTPHIMIVDDDREIRSLLAQFLTKHGYRVTAARDGQEMTKLMEAARVDLLVLDLMMPGEDGLSICRRLRAAGDLPIIMLTAMGEETDRIVGLEMGADDYLAKPFGPRELLARIKAVLRRASLPPPPLAATAEAAATEAAGKALRFEGWGLDLARRELRSPDGTLVALSSGEYDLLVALAERPQRVLSRDQLLDLARGRAAVPFDRAIDVQISRLRRKIEADPADPQIIKTVRGGGYMFTPTVTVG